MTQKQYVKTISFCNHKCDNFYHNYDDGENCWCSKLNKKVAPPGDCCDVMCDYLPREIPEECPLDNVKNDVKDQYKVKIYSGIVEDSNIEYEKIVEFPKVIYWSKSPGFATIEKVEGDLNDYHSFK